jgi:hypothetical protein
MDFQETRQSKSKSLALGGQNHSIWAHFQSIRITNESMEPFSFFIFFMMPDTLAIIGSASNQHALLHLPHVAQR